jgi:hypothetical protein
VGGGRHVQDGAVDVEEMDLQALNKDRFVD